MEWSYTSIRWYRHFNEYLPLRYMSTGHNRDTSGGGTGTRGYRKVDGIVSLRSRFTY